VYAQKAATLLSSQRAIMDEKHVPGMCARARRRRRRGGKLTYCYRVYFVNIAQGNGYGE